MYIIFDWLDSYGCLDTIEIVYDGFKVLNDDNFKLATHQINDRINYCLTLTLIFMLYFPFKIIYAHQ